MIRRLFVLIALCCAAMQAATYYVDGTNGNDTWTGLLAAPNGGHTDGPFATLSQARTAMRASGTNLTTTIRAGTYSIASNLDLIWMDAGETWIAYPNEAPVLNGATTGTVTITGTSAITFWGLTFNNLLSGGIAFNGGDGVVFRWNTFTSCTGNCVSGGGVTNMWFDSNTLNGVTSDSALKIWFGSSNNMISHNLFENCQSGGVNIEAGTGDPQINNNIVDRNIFNTIDTTATDGGAIYFVDQNHTSTGNQITNNLILNNGVGTGNSIKAIYLDDLMSNVTVTGNICAKCGTYAFQIHGGDNNLVQNNIFDLSSGAQLGFYQVSTFGDFGMNGNVVQKNLVYFSGSAPTTLWTVIKNGGDALPTDTTNLYFSATGASIPNTTVVDASPQLLNPQFLNAANNGYAMPAGSAAFSTVGFLPLATDQGPITGGQGFFAGKLTGAAIHQ